jgi:hypothetical protein
MSTPLTAPYRVEIPITAQGASHKMHLYCAVAPSADATGYDVVDRLVGSGLGLSTAVSALSSLLAPLYSSADASFGDAILQQYSAGSWLPIVTTPMTTQPSSGSSTAAGTQMTLSMRDSAFHKVRHIALDAVIGGPQKFITPTGGPAVVDSWATAFVVPSIFASSNPWLWVRSRGNLFIGSFVSIVIADNDAVRTQHSLR